MLRAEGADVLPLVGAGLAIDAGAPPASDLAADLIDRFGLSDPSLDLGTASAAAVAKSDLIAVQVAIAELVARTRPRPTAALTALASAPGRVVLTTNYDDAIEAAARSRGTAPIALDLADEHILRPPGLDEIYVVHLHGVVERPETLVLPGEQMEQLKRAERFQRFLTGVIAPRRLLCLGFALGESEVHLRAQLEWLAGQLRTPRRHSLLLGSSQLTARRVELNELARSSNVDVVPYDDRQDHSAVTEVAQSLAPRSYDRASDATAERRLTWVQPIMLTQKPGTTLEALEQQVSSFDFSGASSDNIESPAHLADHQRSLVVAAPGMGKSKLVTWLPFVLGTQSAVGSLRHFRPDEATQLDRDVLSLLRDPQTEEAITVEAWTSSRLTVILDGLDELNATLHPAAVRALEMLVAEHPEHRIILTTRPVQAVDELSSHDFRLSRILPSRRWAEKYLETRALTASQVSVALESQPLGDLVAVPLFAELVADRLLDERAPMLDALELLVSSQLDAIRREAQRAVVAREPLEHWLRSLAVGLQLRNRTAIDVSELNPPAAMTSPTEALERLRQASVLGDQPNEAAFIRRTLQEAVVADSIITHPEPIKAFNWAATGDVLGQRTIRADFDFVADLVFEHAPQAVRAQLRAVDEERWSRTVASHGTIEDGREAFKQLEVWHRYHGIAYVSFVLRSVLRSPQQAIVSICRRWPEIVRSRRQRLLRELRTGSEATRLRALTVLGALAPDSATRMLVVGCISDASRPIAMLAAGTARSYRLEEATDALKENLKASDAGIRLSSMRALFDIVPNHRLSELGPLLGIGGVPAPIAEELNKRLNLDDCLAFVGSLTHRSATATWLIDRLVDSTPSSAWTAHRAVRLFATLGMSGQAPTNYEPIAAKLLANLSAVLAAARPRRSAAAPHAWTLPLDQARVLLMLDPAALAAADPSSEMLSALQEARDELAHRPQPHTREQRRADLEALINETPPNFDTIAGSGSFRDLDADYRRRLADAVDAAWPGDAIDAGEGWIQHSVLLVGWEAQVPISATRWRQLLRAHFHAPKGYGLGDPRVSHWLGETRPDDAVADVALLLNDASTADQLVRLCIAGGLKDQKLASAAVAKVCALDTEIDGWESAAGYIAKRVADPSAVLEHAGRFRDQLIVLLARDGNREARMEVLGILTEQVQHGEDPAAPQWLNPQFDESFVGPLLQLAREVEDGSKLLSFAVSSIGRINSMSSVRALSELATERSNLWWIGLEAEGVARRQATEEALRRHPEDVLMAAAAFFGAS
jgi:hypothetical protein